MSIVISCLTQQVELPPARPSSCIQRCCVSEVPPNYFIDIVNIKPIVRFCLLWKGVSNIRVLLRKLEPPQWLRRKGGIATHVVSASGEFVSGSTNTRSAFIEAHQSGKAKALGAIRDLRTAAEALANIEAMARYVKDKARSFNSLGDFLLSQVRYVRDGVIDNRHVRAPTGLSEGADGLLVPPQFVARLLNEIYDRYSFVATLCDRRPTDFPLASVEIPGVDETSRQDGSRSGGLKSYWVAEADSVSPSLPRYKKLAFGPKKVVCLVYGTSQLVADSALFNGHVNHAVPLELAAKLDTSIY
jgi:HK97 family phage major capsid protein